MIQLDNVFKFYKVENHRKLILDHVSMVFDTSYSYGILGVNGAGKSTTLRLLSGTELPNSGRIRKTVRISWPIGFSGGFHPHMSGRQNVHFIARAYGADIRKADRFVEEFSELGEYLDIPIKTYSSGMAARLGFALSMAIEFDVYLIDEVTAVGDARFQKRCQEAFDERRKNSGLIVVSHSMRTISDYCDKGLVLADGRLIMYDDVNDAIRMYNRLNK
ncbi:ABC transporter ATP-binding protein [Labrys okinawensis]|uniref:ABC transporter ATP-binding protein n=1 Tax=Labrys okinawensis TaxID=346911 RepID=UPI0039BC9774